MKYYLDLLMSLIEDARMNLNDSAKYMSLTDPEIIGMSQKLDSLLNEYYSITESYRIAS
ncbi:spo0E like sporulation regulatory family protein [Desulfosporosinus sp. OT]|nr:spo0E like sporulation regulatory family protein [Desulfosporosinus sp. OT]